MWVYRKIKQDRDMYLFVVGYWVHETWYPVDEYSTELDARRQVNYLNGGSTNYAI